MNNYPRFINVRTAHLLLVPIQLAILHPLFVVWNGNVLISPSAPILPNPHNNLWEAQSCGHIVRHPSNFRLGLPFVCLAGAGTRQPYQNPFEISLEPRPTGSNIAIERSQSDRPPLPRRQTTSDVPRSPTFPSNTPEALSEARGPSVYDPIYDQRRGSRGQLLPFEGGQSVEAVDEAPLPPQYPPLPPFRTSQHPSSGPYPPAPSPRYSPYTTERPLYDLPPRRRYSQTMPREYPQPPSPQQYQLRSPPIPGRTAPVYPPEVYPSYPAPAYARGARRPSGGSYNEERRPSRQESHRYPVPIPYGSSYPPTYQYEYSGGRGYYDAYQGWSEYNPDRRLSQQEPGEQVSHLGVPERSYRPQLLGGPSSPSSIRVQPPPHSTGLGSGPPGKRRGNLPKESKEKLKAWLSMHVEHPYPTEEEKKELASEAGMTMGQVIISISKLWC